MIIKTISLHTTSNFPEHKEKFLRNFEQLYQLPILRPTLNLITTKAKSELVKFAIEPSKVWNRLAGHCQTESIFSKIGDFFLRNHKHIISIKSINSEVIIHEIAHAIEKESGIDLNDEFRKVLGLDMKNRQSNNIQVARGVETIMVEQLKGYDKKHIMSELFARYFELLAMSYEVSGWSEYQFHYDDVTKYFANTTIWIEDVFNGIIGKKIDKKVLQWSNKLIQNLEPYKKKWTDDVKSESSKTQRSDAIGSKKWTGRTKSIGDWQKSYEEFSGEKLEDK